MLIIKTKGIFKHNHRITGYTSTPYLIVKNQVTDGIDRIHANLYGICDVCDKVILVAKTHLPKNQNR